MVGINPKMGSKQQEPSPSLSPRSPSPHSMTTEARVMHFMDRLSLWWLGLYSLYGITYNWRILFLGAHLKPLVFSFHSFLLIAHLFDLAGLLLRKRSLVQIGHIAFVVQMRTCQVFAVIHIIAFVVLTFAVDGAGSPTMDYYASFANDNIPTFKSVWVTGFGTTRSVLLTLAVVECLAALYFYIIAYFIQSIMDSDYFQTKKEQQEDSAQFILSPV